jgi:hypothetical protein
VGKNLGKREKEGKKMMIRGEKGGEKGERG